MYRKILLVLLVFSFIGCHSVKWNEINTTGDTSVAPEVVTSIFEKYPNKKMTLKAINPGYKYLYDVGEKDSVYGKNAKSFRFTEIVITLLDKMPKGKILVDFKFLDAKSNSVHVNNVDLLRLIPKFDTAGQMNYPEMITEEYNRFGYVFRKEHNEFSITLNEDSKKELQEATDRTYRCKITNNCLAPTKWEFDLTSEDYTDFNTRLKDASNLNQNRILSHSWFYIDTDLYATLMKIKNPNMDIPVSIEYDTLSKIAEEVVVDFNKLRSPIIKREYSKVIEFGYKSGRKIEPLDVEQHYKKKFELLLKGDVSTYTSVLEEPIHTTQFKDEGFYKSETPKIFDLKWMKYLDSVYLNTIDVKDAQTYVEIEITGKWAPYKITIGNVDLAQLNEQKLHGMLFGFNTYPKTRRYNTIQSTINYDADLLPEHLKPYVVLSQKENNKWVNNQYKGVEKIYLSYDSIEQDILEVYVLSYERITPVWMAKIKLPKSLREKIRIRKQLYQY